jgi:hypothetical protein
MPVFLRRFCVSPTGSPRAWRSRWRRFRGSDAGIWLDLSLLALLYAVLALQVVPWVLTLPYWHPER